MAAETVGPARVRTHARTVTIEWGDCDPAGIVFYPRFFAMFDASTAALLAHGLGMGKAEMLRHFGIVGIPMVDTGARFLIPSSFGDTVTIESRISAFRRASFDVAHRLLRPDGALGIEARETRVWVAYDPSRPGGIRATPIPDAVIARFETNVLEESS